MTFSISEPQLPHLDNGDVDSMPVCFIGSSEMIHVRDLALRKCDDLFDIAPKRSTVAQLI